MFLTPYNTADAKRHQQMEPLVEIYQDKGGSECRYAPRFLAGTNTIDEYCAFEILDGKTLGSASGVGAGGSSSGPAAQGDLRHQRPADEGPLFRRLGLSGKDYVDIGYKGGVPMGGDLPARGAGAAAPTFITSAVWDDQIRTKLQQIQIIKGWVDAKGDTHEKVYTVAGDPGSPLNPQASVDAKTCKAKPDLGRERLCSVWRDPQFDGRHLRRVLKAEAPSFKIEADSSHTGVFKDYAELGVQHILTGRDHLLFVLALVLLVGWGRSLAWTITAFTAGHSVTLAFASFGLVHVPQAVLYPSGQDT